MALRAAVIGDSAMWGQGLAREHTYAHLALSRIAQVRGQDLEVLPGRSSFQPERGEARSGAKIRQKPDVDAARFIDSFPRLVRSEQERLDLLFGADESPGSRLFGEHPATFPTVTDAVRHLGEQGGGAAVDLVLMDGGINDIDFEEVLDPEGPALSTINRNLQAIFSDSLGQLLRDGRRAFPRAVIVYVGYFSAFSNKTDVGELERLAKYMSDQPGWKIAFNDAVNEVPVLRDLLNSFLTKDTAALLRTAIRRSTVAAAFAHFWTRRTIALTPASVRGPGIVYAHPGFRPEHALFASRSLLHQGYRLPGSGGPHEVADEMLTARRSSRNVPRLDLLARFRALFGVATLLKAGFGSDELPKFRSDLRALVTVQDLPTTLRSAAKAMADGNQARLDELHTELAREIGRIEVVQIASFVHPNEAGARQYAERIVARVADHRGWSLRRGMASMKQAGQTVLPVRVALRRHGFPLDRGLRRLAQFARIESFALQFEKLPSGLFPLTIRLGATELECLVVRNSSQRFFMTFDVDLALGTMSEITLTERPLFVVSNGVPTFERLVVFVNGVEYRSFGSADGNRTERTLVLWKQG